MKSVAAKIMGGRKKEENEETMTLTAEQQKEIKEGILKWETIITRITNTMVSSTTTSASSSEESSVGKETETSAKGESETSAKGESETSAKGESKTSAKGESEPSAKNESKTSAKGESEASAKGESETSAKGESETSAKGESETSSSKTAEASQSSSLTVTQVEEETSKDVSTFIMNLEKKCPQKEEFKVFFEQLKGTMIAPRKERKGLFSRIKTAAGKISGAMQVMRSRIGSKSAEVTL